MRSERYSIVFSSMTGNTEKLARAIREVLPEEICDYFGAAGEEELRSELLYIGFWTDKGNADETTLRLLQKLKNRKIFLFGTAGFGGSAVYDEQILNHVKQFIDGSNTVVGTFMCQGKMPLSVRERYVKMREQPNRMADLDSRIENFDRALSRPNAEDLENLKKHVLQ